MRLLVILALLTIAPALLGADVPIVKENLTSAWQVVQDGEYIPYHALNETAATIHIPLPLSLYRGDFIQVTGAKRFHVLVNGKLIVSGKREVTLAIDSLSQLVQSTRIMISVYMPGGIRPADLATNMVAFVPGYPVTDGGPVPRQSNVFLNFVVAGAFVLMIFYVFLLRLNPKLTMQYVSFVGMISLREPEEGHAFSRIATSANVIIYIFISMVIGYTGLLVMQHQSLDSVTFNSVLIAWLQLTGVVAMMFPVKAVLVLLLAYLFGISDQAGYQFFNFNRVVLLGALVIGAISAVIFIVGGDGVAPSFLFMAAWWLLVIWIVMCFLKLLNRASLPVFHLFSYLCATEIIPFLLITKIFYK